MVFCLSTGWAGAAGDHQWRPTICNISMWTMACAARCDPERTMEEKDEVGAPKIVDRRTFQAELDALRVREKAHTREGDTIAAARRRLSIVEVDGATPLIGERGAVTLLDTFEGRRMLIAYYFMWQTGHPAPDRKSTRLNSSHL